MGLKVDGSVVSEQILDRTVINVCRAALNDFECGTLD
jgi:hypothetical protein